MKSTGLSLSLPVESIAAQVKDHERLGNFMPFSNLINILKVFFQQDFEFE